MTQPSKPRVAVISHNLGAWSETFIYRQLSGLTRVAATAFTHNRENPDVFPFERVKILPQKTMVTSLLSRGLFAKSVPAEFFLLRKAIKKLDPDVIHFQQAFIPARISNGIKDLKKPICITVWGTDLVNPIYHKPLLKIAPYIEYLICVSDFLKGIALDFGFPENKIKTLFGGAPVGENSEPLPPRENLFRFLCPARFSKVKDHDTLLKAVKTVVAQFGERNFCLDLVGDGELKQGLHDLVRELDIAPQVRFLGVKTPPQVLDCLKESHAVVLTSRRICFAEFNGVKQYQEEGLPISLCEGAAFGRPLIGTRSGGIPEIIRHHENGLLSKEGDIEGIAKAMLAFIRDREMVEKMGQQSRKTARLEFDSLVQTKKLEDLYLEMAKKA